jgi:hypothetical protein
MQSGKVKRIKNVLALFTTARSSLITLGASPMVIPGKKIKSPCRRMQASVHVPAHASKRLPCLCSCAQQ